MSNEDIADTLFADEEDMATLATQSELFRLIGVKDGDPLLSPTHASLKARARDELRAELRNKLKDYCGIVG